MCGDEAESVWEVLGKALEILRRQGQYTLEDSRKDASQSYAAEIIQLSRRTGVSRCNSRGWTGFNMSEQRDVGGGTDGRPKAAKCQARTSTCLGSSARTQHIVNSRR
jgi:hypothetical protein